MKFTKMQGAGNDFLVINNIEEKLPQGTGFAALARRLCTRRMSIGADGMMDRGSRRKTAAITACIFIMRTAASEKCVATARAVSPDTVMKRGWQARRSVWRRRPDWSSDSAEISGCTPYV